MIIAMTGHRPERILDEQQVRLSIAQVFEHLKPEIVIQGMARGVDVWSSAEAWKQGIPYHAVKPWEGHRAVPDEHFDWIIRNASQVSSVNPSENYPGVWVYQKRNEFMIDLAETVLAVWDKNKTGGTWNAINYAKKQGKEIIVISPDGTQIEYDYFAVTSPIQEISEDQPIDILDILS